MAIISEYDGFIIYSDSGKLFAIVESSPPTLPIEVKEVHRVSYQEAEMCSDAELLELCPVEYDLSGEPVSESDYVFWKYVDENEKQQSLKVTPELDEKYKEACVLCKEKHKAIYGKYPNDCAFRAFDNEYCSDIVTAERLSKTGV